MIYYLILIFLGAFRIGQPTTGVYEETCTGTKFAQINADGTRDAMAGGKSSYLGRLVEPDDWGVAHRTLPFGTRIEITNVRTGKVASNVTVIDRGPFGRYKDPENKTGWSSGVALYRKHNKAGKPIPTDGWRGCLDMTPDVVKALGHNGREKIEFRVTRWPDEKSKKRDDNNT